MRRLQTPDRRRNPNYGKQKPRRRRGSLLGQYGSNGVLNMRLDMYLYKNGDTNNELAYWYKSNAILHWFDTNLNSAKNYKQFRPPRRKGVQNKTPYEVTKEEYYKLIQDCKQTLQHKGNTEKIPECLKPICNSALGSRALNDFYWDDLEETIEMLTESESKINWNKDKIMFQIKY